MGEFEISDLAELTYFLGTEFIPTSKGVFMHQKKYATDILKRFNMLDCNPTLTPVETGTRLVKEGDEDLVNSTQYRQLVGSLRYLCTTKPDLAYAVGLISRFMEKPRASHQVVGKRILRYIKGTLDFGLLFPNDFQCRSVEIVGYTDSNWCGDKNDRKSTGEYVFMCGNGSISWSSKKQDVVVLSSFEVEYIAASFGACQVAWLETLLKEMKLKVAIPLKMRTDNKSVIHLAKHPVAHGRSKHI